MIGSMQLTGPITAVDPSGYIQVAGLAFALKGLPVPERHQIAILKAQLNHASPKSEDNVWDITELSVLAIGTTIESAIASAPAPAAPTPIAPAEQAAPTATKSPAAFGSMLKRGSLPAQAQSAAPGPKPSQEGAAAPIPTPPASRFSMSRPAQAAPKTTPQQQAPQPESSPGGSRFSGMTRSRPATLAPAAAAPASRPAFSPAGFDEDDDIPF